MLRYVQMDWQLSALRILDDIGELRLVPANTIDSVSNLAQFDAELVKPALTVCFYVTHSA